MRSGSRLSFAFTIAVVLALFNLAGKARSAEADEAVSAAQNIMNIIVKKDFDALWNETSDWYKNKVGMKKPAYIANWALSRQGFAPLKNSDLIDVQFNTS